ncbi:Uncharacterized protein family [Macleaya cordata]|uniref:Uncharacterized protein family n=1 Tax=Macleaya cordata TaxID=56857 RepID=A0A200QRM7_MACCD|nr:Uncharacterized protein family [Macleaya cordata]
MQVAWECTPAKELSWNLLSLFTASGMLFMEISLVAFSLQGNDASGLEALTRTFVVSGIIVGVDILLKVIYGPTWYAGKICRMQITTAVVVVVCMDKQGHANFPCIPSRAYVFGFGVPLFIGHNETTNRLKWGLWIFHKLLLTAAYSFILFIHHLKWREKLPAIPAFYKYISVMFCLNAIALFACGFVANGVGFGIWLNDPSTTPSISLFYDDLKKSVVIMQEEGFHLENVYYSEMKYAGFFDADWESSE